MSYLSKNSALPSLIILDRDGVINEDSDQYIKSADQWHDIQGSIQAIAELTKLHIPIAIATNQSGLARGYFDLITLYEMHSKMLNKVKALNGMINYIAYCPHGPNDQCHCRKPNIGLLEEISNKLQIPLNQKVFFIGDSYKDIQAAITANITPILVKSGKGKKTLKTHPDLEGNINIYDNLYDFVQTLHPEV
ncbi:D-glycero-beta-D-manno-heptose 1,7-bisphosphate 7-phosphatase [Thiotrichales bacterium 19S3-7]|nr:D-glycero-beta-D-manno-heptose 1,7-bisphosphate 7-phosphatase [Thiotrichales bacterium 19S3-7]MCF6802104.1 D-glycero-beta-D-manno-heptose 1,7-bisphosphate 7-phosphatase [Thiotrichales bacterium 19S3-11]